jgi:hypothetical protein
MSDMPNDKCSHCGSQRDHDLRIPCEVCKSRKTFLLGYSYGIEAKHFKIFLFAIFLIFVFAISAGAIYLFIRFNELASAIFTFSVFADIPIFSYLIRIV